MFGASQNAAGYHPGFCERFLHVGTDWRNGAKAFAIVYQSQRNTIDVELLNRVFGNLGRLAYALPGHRWSVRVPPHEDAAPLQSVSFKSANAIPCPAAD